MSSKNKCRYKTEEGICKIHPKSSQFIDIPPQEANCEDIDKDYCYYKQLQTALKSMSSYEQTIGALKTTLSTTETCLQTVLAENERKTKALEEITLVNLTVVPLSDEELKDCESCYMNNFFSNYASFDEAKNIATKALQEGQG